MLVTLLGITTLISPVKFLNAFARMLLTFLVIIILKLDGKLLEYKVRSGLSPIVKVSPSQPLNAELPISVTLSGIFTLVSPVQPSNADFPMAFTLLGITMPVSPVQS